MKKNERAREEGTGGGAPTLKLPLIPSLWEDEGRRVLSILLVFLIVCIFAALAMNLAYKPNYKLGGFMGFENMKNSYERVLIPVGMLLALVSLLFFSLSVSYGQYTEVVIGKKSVLAKKLFRKLSFYSAMMGAILLLSGGIANSISTTF